MTFSNVQKLHSQLLCASTILHVGLTIELFELDWHFISISEWTWFYKRWQLPRDRHEWQFIFSGSSQRSTSECVDTYGKELKCPHSLCVSSSFSQWEGMFQSNWPMRRFLSKLYIRMHSSYNIYVFIWWLHITLFLSSTCILFNYFTPFTREKNDVYNCTFIASNFDYMLYFYYFWWFFLYIR